MAGCADDAISVSAAFADPLLMWLDVEPASPALRRLLSLQPGLAFVPLAPPLKL